MEVSRVPKVNFKSYLSPVPVERLPSDLEVIVATYGPYLTVTEVAECLKRDRRTVERWLRSHELEASQGGRGKSYIVPATSVVKFVRGMKSA